ncbi:phage scaffolding protein [Cohnella panacarvi]|uniref:phage scaffolding protein n=1 Tax=Cohnella panacarvi TaxID=400776 RepID=UPI00047C8AA9|nr:phage scaffolding protein [Cohnella panacarvi]
MDWLKDLARSHGIADPRVNEFVNRIGKELPKHLIPKQRYNALNESKKKVVERLRERDKQLEELQASIDSSKTRKLRMDKLRIENKRLKEKYESEIRQLRLLTALLIAIGGCCREPTESSR